MAIVAADRRRDSGHGLHRQVEAAAILDAIISINGASMAPTGGPAILAVDLPSGLDCDTGIPSNPTVRADMTVTFVAEKIGF